VAYRVATVDCGSMGQEYCSASPLSPRLPAPGKSALTDGLGSHKLILCSAVILLCARYVCLYDDGRRETRFFRRVFL